MTTGDRLSAKAREETASSAFCITACFVTIKELREYWSSRLKALDVNEADVSGMLALTWFNHGRLKAP